MDAETAGWKRLCEAIALVLEKTASECGVKWYSLVQTADVWERRMDAEFRFHLESQIADYVSQGLSREEAERRAQTRVRAGRAGERRVPRPSGLPNGWITFLRDVRYAVPLSAEESWILGEPPSSRSALGIGANTAIFSVVHSVLLNRFRMPDPEQIYSVES